MNTVVCRRSELIKTYQVISEKTLFFQTIHNKILKVFLFQNRSYGVIILKILFFTVLFTKQGYVYTREIIRIIRRTQISQ